MRKKLHIFASFIIVVSVIFVALSPVAYAKQQEFSAKHTFANESLAELIEVWAKDDQYDQIEAQNMIDRMAVIPERMIAKSVSEGVRLLFIDFPLTELDDFGYLSGLVPRGWEHTDYTWDDVPGAGGQTTVARIGHSNPDDIHGSINLEYHEFGHAIDDYMLGYPINELDEFIAIYKAEKHALWGNDAYMDYVDEYFAESIALYFLGGDDKERLRANAPETYHFMDTLTERILSVEENDAYGIALSWEAIENARKYEIYRDGEKIAETDQARYIDQDFTDYTFHEYVVQAINEADEKINESFSTEVITSELAVPKTPSSFLGALDGSKVTLTWDAVELATEYDIIRNGELIDTVTGTEYMDHTLREGETYTYTVQALNRAGTSESAEVIRLRPAIEKNVENERDDQVEKVPEDAEPKNNQSNAWMYAGFGLALGLCVVGSLIYIRRRK